MLNHWISCISNEYFLLAIDASILPVSTWNWHTSISFFFYYSLFLFSHLDFRRFYSFVLPCICYNMLGEQKVRSWCNELWNISSYVSLGQLVFWVILFFDVLVHPVRRMVRNEVAFILFFDDTECWLRGYEIYVYKWTAIPVPVVHKLDCSFVFRENLRSLNFNNVLHWCWYDSVLILLTVK